MREIDPKQTKRAMAFEMWMKAPMPMVTLFKTLDITKLIKFGRKKGYKFNMLMCWCIGKVASQADDFYILPIGNKLIQYDKLAINTIVDTKDGGISNCDIPFDEDLRKFNRDYLELTGRVRETGEMYSVGDDYAIIGTSAITQYEIDGAVNIYSGIYNNPFMIWGKYKKGILKTRLVVSFQFHHTQLDGIPAAQFLECLQRQINKLHIV